MIGRREGAMIRKAGKLMIQKRPAVERISQEIIRLCHMGLDSRTLRIETIKRLRKVIPIDVSFFATADPATLLFTGAIADDILERATPQFIENEFFQDDVNKFAWLARSTPPVSGLAQVTQHRLEDSLRYRDILAPLDLGDELRAALITNDVCWGFLCLHRDRSSPTFTHSEAALLRRLAPHLAEGLRKALLLGEGTGVTCSEEPGLLLLANDLSVAAMTPTAERWLAEVRDAGRTSTLELPQAVYAAAARLQALERNSEGQSDLMPKVRLRAASGQWLVLHASRLAGMNSDTNATHTDRQIAVIFEVARPVELAPLIAQAYALSRRESEIVQLVVRGEATKEIAALLQISSNTVQDHLKAIFEKVGVRSRRELVGRLFAQQYQPRIAAGTGLGADGWFS
jgi:DNA-binding CsgD family transcriptional regulator